MGYKNGFILPYLRRIFPGAKSAAAELRAEFILCLVQRPLAPGGQAAAGPVDVERQHRQRGPVGISLSPPAAQGRALERGRDLLRALLGEHPAFEIERVAVLGHALGPPPPLAGGRTAPSSVS